MKRSMNWIRSALFSTLLIAGAGGQAGAKTVTIDFEDYALDSIFSGVRGQFSVETVFGEPLRIHPKFGTYSPSLPGLGSHTLLPDLIGGSSPFLPDFLIEFNGKISFFEIYVLDAEEPFQLTTENGLRGTVTNFGFGPGGPVRKVQIGPVSGPDKFRTVFFDVQNFPAELGGSGPGPWDLLTFDRAPEPGGASETDEVPEPTSLALVGIGLVGLGFLRRRNMT